MLEKDLAQEFVKYLSCYDLYFEVDVEHPIDIVAITENTCSAYEVKISFNFEVLEQAVRNKRNFHYSYVAVPYTDSLYFSNFKKNLCETLGVGLLVIKPNGRAAQLVKPKLNRAINFKQTLGRLHEYQKQCVPGTKCGDTGKITSFQVTVDNAERYAIRHPGCTLAEIINGISHHYITDEVAKRNIATWIRQGVIKTLKIVNKKVYYNEL